MGKILPTALKGESVSAPSVGTQTPTNSGHQKAGAGPGVGVAVSKPAAQLVARRRLTWTCIVAFLSASLLMFLRYFFPRALFEPSSRFRIGSVADFGLGVDERFKQSRRIWVVREPDKLFVIFARCTHLGCIPNWLESENKFKCPCHGSGYDIEGRNFEGPAPRPMDRTHVELDAEGQIVVDTSRLYSCPPGAACQFESQDSYLVVS